MHRKHGHYRDDLTFSKVTGENLTDLLSFDAVFVVVVKVVIKASLGPISRFNEACKARNDLLMPIFLGHDH